MMLQIPLFVSSVR